MSCSSTCIRRIWSGVMRGGATGGGGFSAGGACSAVLLAARLRAGGLAGRVSDTHLLLFGCFASSWCGDAVVRDRSLPGASDILQSVPGQQAPLVEHSAGDGDLVGGEPEFRGHGDAAVESGVVPVPLEHPAGAAVGVGLVLG